jgi:GNAT superfamily N-acetyltransferase
MLGTLPEYRRLGVASMVVEWGVELADRDGLECFVGASDQGKHDTPSLVFCPVGHLRLMAILWSSTLGRQRSSEAWI